MQTTIKNFAYLCTVCSSNQTCHLSPELTGGSDGIECYRRQLLIVVLCNHQGALKPLKETSLLEKTCESITREKKRAFSIKLL